MRLKLKNSLYRKLLCRHSVRVFWHSEVALQDTHYSRSGAKLPGASWKFPIRPPGHCELQGACEDFVYAILFFTLPWIAWHGLYVIALAGLFLLEVALTLWDFVVEDWIRKPLGGLYPGERIMHALMGIVYGAMLASIVPTLRVWWSQSTALIKSPPKLPEGLRWTMMAMAVGVVLSGLRDLCAAAGLPGSAWSWTPGKGSSS